MTAMIINLLKDSWIHMVIQSPPKFNLLSLMPLLTFPENFFKTQPFANILQTNTHQQKHARLGGHKYRSFYRVKARKDFFWLLC